MAKAWIIGNTTVRNPYRLKEGLRILAGSPLHGNLAGHDNEAQFAQLLHDSGIVLVARLQGDNPRDASDVGRKWRAALMQIGFITAGSASDPWKITENGRRLINSETVASEQEVFLRALAAYQIPSSIEHYIPGPVFSPLRLVIETIARLENEGMEAYISFEEMASIVQVGRDINAINLIIQRIQEYRTGRKQAADKDAYDRAYREQEAMVAQLESQSTNTLTDYADTNLRYLKATGLFSTVRRGIGFASGKRTLVDQLRAQPFTPLDDASYLPTLWRGAELPTDHAPEAAQAIFALAELLKQSDDSVTLPDLVKLSVQDLTQLRLHLDERWRQLQERHYAAEQAASWKDILLYLRPLASGVRGPYPQQEAPAYLEWAVWRAFLAIDSLRNEPWQARRFQIDQDFLPVGTAPGRGPDMLFEFQEYVLVVEVTLTASSRQEAMEGEPVRRHVADLVEKYEESGKVVYGLFIANKIDSNTAETLRIGSWYKGNDERMSLRIVPMTLSQFIALFEAGFSSRGYLGHTSLERILLECLADRNADATQWKVRIGQWIDVAVQRLQHTISDE